MFPSFVPRGWCSATVRCRCRLRARYQRNKRVATVAFRKVRLARDFSLATCANGKVAVWSAPPSAADRHDVLEWMRLSCPTAILPSTPPWYCLLGG